MANRRSTDIDVTLVLGQRQSCVVMSVCVTAKTAPASSQRFDWNSGFCVHSKYETFIFTLHKHLLVKVSLRYIFFACSIWDLRI